MLVALHPEGVDRNPPVRIAHSSAISVALHPEGVDRNLGDELHQERSRVALHPEGVDRNRHRDKRGRTRRGRPPPGGRG